MAEDEERPGSCLKRRSPNEVRVVRASGNEINFEEEIVMGDSSTAVSCVIPFSFGKQQVRTLLIDGEPWFVASDVCDALEMAGRSRNFTRMLDEDEKGAHIVSTPGGDQEMQVVNESGLYALIFKSRKEEAKRFKKWVTSEVLPAIRKNGHYDDQQGRMATLIGQTIGTDGFHMLGAVVKGKVSSLTAPNQRRATAKIWSQTHAAFGVRSAADIPADQLDAARNFIAAYALEGEWLPKEERKLGTFVLDEFQAQDLNNLLHYTDWVSYRWKQGILESGQLAVAVHQLPQLLQAAPGEVRARGWVRC